MTATGYSVSHNTGYQQRVSITSTTHLIHIQNVPFGRRALCRKQASTSAIGRVCALAQTWYQPDRIEHNFDTGLGSTPLNICTFR